MTKPFDLVVHGATGFTGRLVVEYLLQRYPAGSGLRWAMGGRNADKLAAVRDEVGAPADTPLVVTDTSNPASLQALMDATRLVLTTVGPTSCMATNWWPPAPRPGWTMWTCAASLPGCAR